VTGSLRIGLVLRVRDPFVNPPFKTKWHICVCQRRYWFLRINSRPYFSPNLQILESDNPWLDHDSFIELTSVIFLPKSDVRVALLKGDVIDNIATQTAAALRIQLPKIKTITERQKKLILVNLAGI
jgi:hypothetical protein